MNFFNKNLKALIFTILVALFFLTNIYSIQAQTETNTTNLQFIQQLLQSLLDQLQLLQAQILQQPTTVTTTTTGVTSTQSTSTVYISVYSPYRDQSFVRGYVMSITWDSKNVSNRVFIELRKGDNPYAIIQSNVPNTGSYNWTIPSTFPTGTDYKIRITDQSNRNIYGESGYFRILDKPYIQNVEVIAPNEREVVTPGDTIRVKWETSSNLPLTLESIVLRQSSGFNSYKLYYTFVGINEANAIIPSTVPFGIYTLTVNGSFKNYTSSLSRDSSYFAIVPLITIFSPKEGEKFVKGSVLNIKWNPGKGKNTPSTVFIDLFAKNKKVYSIATSAVPNTGSYNWTIPLDFSTGNDYKIRVTYNSNPYDPNVPFDPWTHNMFGESEYFSIVSSADFVSEEIKCIFKGLGSKGTAGCRSVFYNNNLNVYKDLGCNTKAGESSCTVYVKGSKGDRINWTSTCLIATYPATIVDGQNESITFDCSPIHILDPQENFVYNRGSSFYIRWKSEKYVSNRVSIELRKGDKPYVMINSGASNTGAYNWTIPSTFPTGTDYKIRITDWNNRNIYAESKYFSIAPQANVVSEEVKCIFKGLFSGDTAGCRAEFYNDNFYKDKDLGCNTKAGENSCTVYVKGIKGDKIRWDSTCLRLSYQDTIVDGQNESITFDCSPIYISEPKQNSTYNRGSDLRIDWYTAKYVSDRLFIELRKGDNPYAIIKSNVPNPGYYNWTIPSTFPTGTDYKIRITDQSNRNIYGESGSFSIQ